VQLIYERDGIGGFITDDKGVDKTESPQRQLQPGYEIGAQN